VLARGVSVGARVSELVDVGVSGLLLGLSGSDERVDNSRIDSPVSAASARRSSAAVW
jgi:hypothetical protein